MTIIPHSIDLLPRPARPDSGVVLDPEQLSQVAIPSGLPYDFAVVLKREHLAGAHVSTQNPNWIIAKLALQESGYHVVEWHDATADCFCARCTRT